MINLYLLTGSSKSGKSHFIRDLIDAKIVVNAKYNRKKSK